MATVILSSSFDFSAPQDWDWTTTAATAANISITNGTYQQTFAGSFSYNTEGIVSGTVTASSFYSKGSLIYSVTGMTSNATTLQSFVDNAGDTAQTYAYVLQGNDIIKGSAGNDVLLGYGGDDTLYGNGGNDTIDGGTGNNTVVFGGNFAAATISYSATTGKFTIVTASGTDIVSNVQTFTFADKSVAASSLMTPSDTVAPTIASLNPTDGATGVLVGSNLVVTFSEAIQRGTGTIQLKTADGTLIESFDATTSSHLSISGSTLTIDPTNTLANNSHYFVSFSAGSIKDLAGNSYAGSSTYDFTTAAATTTAPTGDLSGITDFDIASSSAAGVAATSTRLKNYGGGTTPALAISGDGRYIVFTSLAGNLVPGDKDPTPVPSGTVFPSDYVSYDSFVKDMTTQSIHFAVTDKSGARVQDTTTDNYKLDQSVFDYGFDYQISADGRYIAFRTDSNRLTSSHASTGIEEISNGTFAEVTRQLSGDFNDRFDVYVKDTVTGSVTLASSNNSGLAPSNEADPTSSDQKSNDIVSFALSADGQYVAFGSSRQSLVNGTTYFYDQIFLKNIATGSIKIVSTSPTGTAGDAGSEAPSFSSDGRYLVFVSGADNLVANTKKYAVSVYREDLSSGNIILVSNSASGTQNNNQVELALSSGDGRYVVFDSDATNLTSNAADGYHEHVFYKDLTTGQIQMVDATKDGVASTGALATSISDDGRYVVFASSTQNLAALPAPQEGYYSYANNLYIRDMLTGEIKVVLISEYGQLLNASDGKISADGQYLVVNGILLRNADDSPTTSDYGNQDQVFRIVNPFLSSASPQTPTSAQAISNLSKGTLTTAVGVSDSAGNVSANLDGLQGVAAAGKLASIALTDSGFATISLTAAQLTSDAGALKALTGNFILIENASAANQTFSGMTGHANIAQFSGTASQYSITAGADGTSFTVTDTGTGRTSVDHLSNITALKFSDGTDIVAAHPDNGSSGHVTTGNVTEIYGAVFGRLPDAAGLAYYQDQLKANPQLALTTFAQWFLASPEYTSNSAHNYAQTAAGDAQFITDSYQNLLHRAPETGAIPYYQNLISLVTAGQTPGTAGYTAALASAHATVLVGFSASAEFLGDVQITAQHPADASHWLALI